MPASESNIDSANMRQLDQYCIACHNDALATAGLSLQEVNFSRAGDHAEVLEKVIKKLRSQMMPPAGMPRPETETYEGMTDWLEAELDAAWASNPNPGRKTPLHRMNRLGATTQ